jgi:dihydrofolate synthase/folylpolyglutamate synthase
VSESYRKTPLALAGAHQEQNAALAITALQCGSIIVSEGAIARGLASVRWPARFQRWDERTIIDGAHNPAGARILAKTWREFFGDEHATLILAVLGDKDIAGICRALAPITRHAFLPHVRSERALDPHELAKILSAVTPSLQHSITSSVADAFELARAQSNPILLTGSLHFAGEALATLGGDMAAFEECAQ